MEIKLHKMAGLFVLFVSGFLILDGMLTPSLFSLIVSASAGDAFASVFTDAGKIVIGSILTLAGYLVYEGQVFE